MHHYFLFLLLCLSFVNGYTRGRNYEKLSLPYAEYDQLSAPPSVAHLYQQDFTQDYKNYKRYEQNAYANCRSCSSGCNYDNYFPHESSTYYSEMRVRTTSFDVDNVTASSTLSRAQVQALADLWVSTDGDNWRRNDGWGTGDPCGTPFWFGLNCTTNPFDGSTIIFSVELPNNTLRGSIPDTFATGLPFLFVLDFTLNYLSGTIPASIGYLTQLQLLALPENQLTGTIPSTFKNLSNLKKLSLGTQDLPFYIAYRFNYKGERLNSLPGPLVGDMVSGWTNLEYLNLAFLQLSGTIPAELGNLPNLKVIHLLGNRFTAMDMKFDNLGQLLDFDITRNQIFGELPESLYKATNLLSFSVISNNFYGTIPSSYQTMSSIWQFGVDYNDLTGTLDNLLVPNLRILGAGTNGFTGNPWNKMCTIPSLTTISTVSNRLSGTIPKCFGDLIGLTVLDFTFNPITGTLPTELGKLENLVVFTATGCSQLTGTIPPEYGNLHNLSIFWIPDIPGLISTIPPELGALYRLNSFDVTNSGLYGSIPSQFCNFAGLQYLKLSGNNLDGTIPSCFPQLTNLISLELANNRISGSLPENIGNMASLVNLRLHKNELTGSIPESIGDIKHLLALDLSSNHFEQTIAQIITPLQKVETLTTLNIANNNITGFVEFYLFNDLVNGNYFTKLVDLNMGHNFIEGEIGQSVPTFPSLGKIDISYNLFSGKLYGIGQALTVLIADGNPGLYDGGVPDFLVETDTLVKDTSGKFSCRALTGQQNDLVVQMDPKYFGYANCLCEPGFYGRRNNCTVCLKNGNCDLDRNHTYMVVAAGFYPTPNEDFPEQLIACPQDTFSINPCNPHNEVNFTCLEGHTGRLCAQCESGYRRNGRRCSKCNESLKVITVFFSAVAIFILYVYLLWPRKVITESGLLKNFLFYAQATNFVLETTAQWVDPIPVLKDMYSGTNFNINFLEIDCLSSSFAPSNEYLVTMFLPILFVALTAVVYGGIVLFLMYSKGDIYSLTAWRHRCYFAILFVINSLYFPLTSKIFSAFKCTADPVTHRNYLSNLPYVECTFDNTEYRGIVTVAIIFFIPYVIGIPTLFLYLLTYFRKYQNSGDTRRETRVNTMCGFFILCYESKLFWWEAIIFLRRIIFALLISLVPFTSPFLSLGIFILILVSILVNSWMHPFILNVTNMLDLVSFAIILLTFLSGVLFSSPAFQAYTTQLAITVFVLNMVLIAAYIWSYVVVVLHNQLAFWKADPAGKSKTYVFFRNIIYSLIGQNNASHKVGTMGDLVAISSTPSDLSSSSSLYSSSSSSAPSSPTAAILRSPVEASLSDSSDKLKTSSSGDVELNVRDNK